MKKIMRERRGLINSHFCGFSLVELLVTLIIVSLVMSALAPVITKKMKANAITVGAVGAVEQPENPDDDDDDDDEVQGLDPSCQSGVNEECCKKFGAKFLSNKIMPQYQGPDMCFSQYNAGDNYIEQSNGTYYHPHYAKAGVTLLASNDTCNANTDTIKSCCWTGVSTTNDTLNYPNYPGRYRTICTKAAGERICKNWAPPGALKGTWRLPTEEELGYIATAITGHDIAAGNSLITKYLDGEGLQFCDNDASSYGGNRCQASKVCNGAAASDGYECYPDMVMSQKQNYRFRKGVFKAQGGTSDYARSVRCVTTDPVNPDLAQEYEPGDNEPKNQKDCDSIAPNKDLLFISAEHTGTKNICMFKYNAGDGINDTKDADEFAHQYGVQIVHGGQTCNLSGTGKCCWYDGTGTASGTYKYGGKDRLVCMKNAGNEICNKYTKKIGIWRLPSEIEMQNISIYLNSETIKYNFLSKYLESGLQFCNHNSSASTYGANQCSATKVCDGASASDGYECFPDLIMTQEKSYRFNGAKFTLSGSTDHARSVRCVTDDIKHSTVIDEYVEQSNAEPLESAADESEEARTCPPGTVFISGKHTKNKNLCMFQFNAGDTGTNSREISEFASKYGVQLLLGNATCDLASTGKCCWYDSTASTYTDDGKYGGKDRLVCMKNAGEAICNNYSNKPGLWRLPTENELEALAPYITASSDLSPFLSKYVTDNGLQLCDNNSSSYGSVQCYASKVCNGAANSDGYECYPDLVMSQGQSYRMVNGYFKPTGSTDHARSVRCVADDMTQRTPITQKFNDEPESQTDCPDYSIFIDKKYTGAGSSNLCMLKYNAGDDKLGFTTMDEMKEKLFENVTVKATSKTCKDAPCCWEGATGTGETTEKYSYSGKRRTVCNKAAGELICASLGSNWRLPTELELETMAPYITASSSTDTKFLSKFIDTDGLQLCDNSSSNYGANKCSATKVCDGAANSDGYECYPDLVISQGQSYRMVNGYFKPTGSTDHARSVRCVTDKKLGYSEP